MNENTLFSNEKKSYYRFDEQQIEGQKIELINYILTELSDDSVESLQEGIMEIKKLTGYEFTLEEAFRIRKSAINEQIVDSKKIK